MQKHNLIAELERLSIRDITADSRRVVPDCAYFAINEAYIDEAIKKGAKVIVKKGDHTTIIMPAYDLSFHRSHEISDQVRDDYITITVPDIRVALAEAAEWLYPEAPKHLVAVTGTSGKTSTVNYYMQICELLGHKAASMGSLGVKCTDKKLEAELKREDDLNTPDILTTRKILSALKKGGIDFLAFEASSHGLDQKRICGIKVEAAGFTNLSHDHLDYHKTMEAYLDAKLKLFSENLLPDGRIVAEAKVANFIKSAQDIVLINSHAGLDNNISNGSSCEVKIISSEHSAEGQEIEFTYLDKKYIFSTHISGSFQASNILMAATLAEKATGDFNEIVRILPKLKSVEGRLERVTDPLHTYQVFVDYSHKPAALESVLLELKAITKSRLIVVFGCGGNRDTTKRPVMGEIASRIADIVIVTDDNPRDEDAALIRSEVMAGTQGAVEIGDRENAIKHAIEEARTGDIILIAGKGHETYQIIGNSKLPFDDRLIAKKYLG